MDKNQLTKLEKYWILYDIGNSAFVLLVSTIIPIYFKNIASANGISLSDSTAYYGYAVSLSTLIVAVIGPVLGTIADTKGYKKPLFTFSMMVGVIGCAALALPSSWIFFLAVFVVAKVGFASSLIFYDAMLSDVTTDDRMDNLSSRLCMGLSRKLCSIYRQPYPCAVRRADRTVDCCGNCNCIPFKCCMVAGLDAAAFKKL